MNGARVHEERLLLLLSVLEAFVIGFFLFWITRRPVVRVDELAHTMAQTYYIIPGTLLVTVPIGLSFVIGRGDLVGTAFSHFVTLFLEWRIFLRQKLTL